MGHSDQWIDLYHGSGVLGNRVEEDVGQYVKSHNTRQLALHHSLLEMAAKPTMGFYIGNISRHANVEEKKSHWIPTSK